MLSVLKAINFRRIEGRGFRSVIFLLLLTLVIYKLENVSFAGATRMNVDALLFLPLILVAVFLNQYCEFRKWKVLAENLGVASTELTRSYFDGLTAGFLTPNGWGTFLGRLVHVDKESRYRLIVGTVLANVAQFMPTVLFGGIALITTSILPPFAGYIAIASAVVVIVAYTFSESLAGILKIPRNPLDEHGSIFAIKWSLAGWSILRYGTFLLQYALFFFAFGYFDFFAFLPGVAILFVLTSVVPSLWSGKVLIREAAAIFVFSGTEFDLGTVLVICLLVWLSNVIAPVLFGALRNLVLSRNTAHALD